MKKKSFNFPKVIAATAFATAMSAQCLFSEPPAGKNWKLVFEDSFDYPNATLDEAWISQNGPSGHILCSRWRENVVAGNGTLKLINKREKRGGQDFTSGSIWTKKSFRYGYFECRYKYSKATFSNNSFWLIQTGAVSEGKKFEIDINEGHYPDEVNINLHNWSDFWTDENGKQRHAAKGMNFCMSSGKEGAETRSIALDVPVTASKVRITTNTKPIFINEIRIFPKISEAYPNPKIQESTLPDDLENFAVGANVKFSYGGGPFRDFSPLAYMVDGDTSTTYKSWPKSYPKDLPTTFEIDLGGKKSVGCIQIFSGVLRREINEYQSFLRDYVIEVFDDGKWAKLSSLGYGENVKVDLSEDYHVYALQWDEENLVYYFDGKEIFRQKNEFCRAPSPVYLSLALGRWCGPVIEETADGTFMEVDYVKVWQDADLKTSMLVEPKVKETKPSSKAAGKTK